LLHFVPQFSQLINAALFVPPLLAFKTQLDKCGTKKSGKPKLKNMAFIRKSITSTMPGVLPVMVRKWVANPHATHFLHNPKRHHYSGVTAAHVLSISDSEAPDFLDPQ